MSEHTRRLTELGLNASHNRDVLIVAILRETADLARLDHWELRAKLQTLRALALRMVEENPRVVGIDLSDFDDYDRPNEHLSQEED